MERNRTKKLKKGILLWGLLLLLSLPGVPALAQVCPPDTVQSSPTSQICVKNVGILTCPAGTLEAFPGSNVCLLDWTVIPKFNQALIIPPVMPSSGVVNGADFYEIAVRQFQQQILPTGSPQTTVWSYGSILNPATFNYPAFTVEAVVNQPTRVKWINELVDGTGAFLPHLLGDAIDQTLHWANPTATGCDDGTNRTDCRGTNPAPYHGPVPIITHVHGAHVGPESDGYPEAWYLPNANNIPAGYASKGSHYGQFDNTNTTPGTAVFQYPNNQKATTLWYHDHALGMTRSNVYAGPAGFWLLRDGDTDVLSGTLPGPAPAAGEPLWLPVARGDGAPPYREIPIAIQDRSFNPNGSLFYPDKRAFFEGVDPADLQIPFIPASDISPIWNPEAFFTTIVVNGRTWPFQNVEPVRYRFRLLNGNNSRFLNLSLMVVGGPLNGTELPFYQIGAEGGLLPKVVKIQRGGTAILPGNGTVPPLTPASDPSKALLLGNAERADVIVDFTGLPSGTVVRMLNTAPDSPFGGFPVDPPADPATTGQVMEFVVLESETPDASTPPANLVLKPRVDLVPTVTRKLSLNEASSDLICAAIDGTGAFVVPIVQVPGVTPPACDANSAPFAPREALLGTVTVDGQGNATGSTPLRWMDAITENPKLGNTETWEIWNFTEDAHPIHLHLVAFQVVNREPFDPETLALSGSPTAPEPWESGEKDTVIAYPGQVTRIRAKFDIAGLYVWHCHIVEHEDNEMMRPYFVGNKAYTAVRGVDDKIYWGSIDFSGAFNNDWSALPTGLTQDAPAVALDSLGRKLHIVVRGLDNGIWGNSVDLTTTNSSGWTRFPAGLTPSAPSIAFNSTTGSLYVAARGLDDKIYGVTADPATWALTSPWTALTGGFTPSAPGIALNLTGGLYVFVRGVDDKIYGATVNPATWALTGPWTAMAAGFTPSAPSIVWNSSENDKLQIVVRGLDNNIYGAWVDSTLGSFSGWTQVPLGKTFDALAAFWNTTDIRLHLVARGIDNRIYNTSLDSGLGTFNGWTVFPTGSTPAAPSVSGN